MVTRRHFLKGLAVMSAGTVGFGGYAMAEPWRLGMTRYAPTPPNWPSGLRLKIAVLTDLHVCEPWMGLQRVRQIVRHTNALGADAVILLGDYVAGYRLARLSNRVPNEAWAEALAGLKAPLGVHAVLGNHDWWDEIEVQKRKSGPVKVGLALEAVGISVYENRAARFVKDGQPFWIAGLGDQWAFKPTVKNGKGFLRRREIQFTGVDDLPGTLRQVTDTAPVILLAHEPDIFPDVPARIAVTLSGHTHGGQVRIAGFAPFVPSKFGPRYCYGHIVEENRDLIVSAGLGCSGLPMRFGAPPEIVMVELGGGSLAVA